MNCCDTYGKCTQGQDCPVRSTPTHQPGAATVAFMSAMPTTSRARKYSCEDLGVCHCAIPCFVESTPLITKQGAATIEPSEQQDQPISVWDGIWFYGTVLITSAASVAVTVGACSYVWHRWVV